MSLASPSAMEAPGQLQGGPEAASPGAEAPAEGLKESRLYESDEFRMYCYKVLPCAKRTSHEWSACPFSHVGEKARRRDPRLYKYLAIPCPDTKEGKTCPRGDDCPNCHSLFEYWLHPSRYRTQLCRNNDGSQCKRQICFFAHSIEELRVPDHSHLNIPEELRAKSAAAATTATAAAAADGGCSSSSSSGSSSAASSPKASTAAAKRAESKKAGPAAKAAKQAGRAGLAAGQLPPLGGLHALSTTTAGALPEQQTAAAAAAQQLAMGGGSLGGSPLGPLTPGPLPLGGPGGAWMVPPYGSAAWSPQCTPGGGLPRSVSLDSRCPPAFAPGTPARGGPGAWPRRGSLDTAWGRTSIGSMAGALPGPHCGSFDIALHQQHAAAHAARTQLQQAQGARLELAASSSLFSSSMPADPEVPDPCASPRSAAIAAALAQQQQQQCQQQQRLLQQLHSEQLEAAMAGYDQHAAAAQAAQLLPLQHQHQQQMQAAAWGCGGRPQQQGSGAFSEYVPSVAGSGSSPPLSPTPGSSVMGGGGGASDEQGVAAPYGAGGGWAPPPLPRALSGPAGYGAAPAAGGGHYAGYGGAMRHNSLDAGAGVSGGPAVSLATQLSSSAAEMAAAAHAQAAALRSAEAQAAQQGGINLRDVAELVESANRGELGDCSNQVLTSVISLLIQQLQQQQLVA